MGAGQGKTRRARNQISSMEANLGIDPGVTGSVPQDQLTEIQAAIATLSDDERQLVLDCLTSVTRDYLGNDDLADRAFRLLEAKVEDGDEVRFDAVYEIARLENNYGQGPNKLGILTRSVLDYQQELRALIPEHYAKMRADAENGVAPVALAAPVAPEARVSSVDITKVKRFYAVVEDEGRLDAMDADWFDQQDAGVVASRAVGQLADELEDHSSGFVISSGDDLELGESEIVEILLEEGAGQTIDQYPDLFSDALPRGLVSITPVAPETASKIESFLSF